MAADGAAPGSAAPAVDWDALRAWLDGARYDAGSRRMVAPAAEFAGRREVLAIMRALHPALAEAPDTLAALFSFLRFLREATERQSHPVL